MDGNDEHERREQSQDADEQAHRDDRKAAPFVVRCGFVRTSLGEDRAVSDESRIEQVEPEVLSGEDDLPRQPPPPIDPYTPAPHPPVGERKVWNRMRLAVIPIAVVVAIIVIAALR